MKKIEDFHLTEVVSEGRIKVKEAPNIEVVRAEVTTYIVSLLETTINDIIHELNYQRDARLNLTERVNEIEDIFHGRNRTFN